MSYSRSIQTDLYQLIADLISPLELMLPFVQAGNEYKAVGKLIWEQFWDGCITSLMEDGGTSGMTRDL
jgi:hypothetical protein